MADQQQSKAKDEEALERTIGARVLKPVQHLLGRLHDVGVDKSRNRKLFCDQYMSMLLIYFFHSTVTSLRALQQATGWENTARKLGLRKTSLGSLSEAQSVFDAQLLEPIVRELAAQALPLSQGREAEALKGLTAVDGSIFPALARMNWALWKDAQHRGVKLHLHFDVFKSVPAKATVTTAACSEPAELAKMLEAGRIYVMDRGYASAALFAAILRAGSSFVGRIKDNAVIIVQEERPISEAARAAGVVRDVIISRLGTPHHKDELKRSMRLIVVQRTDRAGQPDELKLLTDRLDLDADLVALAYRYRWTVELFFRWLKCIMGGRHLLAHSHNGITLQMYAAMIVSLLIVLRTGHKPNKRTFEMIQFYLLGWVTDDEFDAHVARLKPVTPP